MTVSKGATQEFGMERFNLKKLKDVTFREDY
jgi:hypothetical protein